MPSEDEDLNEEAREWVRVERKGSDDPRARRRTVVTSTPDKALERDLEQARRELVRVEKLALQDLVKSEELPAFARRKLIIRLEALGGESEE